MSFKKSLRTAQKVTREIDKAQRAGKRTDEAFARVEAKMRKKPISTLGLVYKPTTGIDSRTIDIKTAGGTMTYGPAKAAPTDARISPRSESVGQVTVKPLDLFVNDWATIVPVEISNNGEGFRPKINWVRKTDRSSSKIFLLDPQHGEYYYPVETDLTGEVLVGHPRTGLFAFEPFRQPTNRIQLHLSGVKVGPSPSDKANLAFDISRSSLSSEIQNSIAGPSIGENLQQSYAEQTGCAVAGLALLGPALIGLLSQFIS